MISFLGFNFPNFFGQALVADGISRLKFGGEEGNLKFLDHPAEFFDRTKLLSRRLKPSGRIY